MACRFSELVVDCSEPARLGEFWREVLGYSLVEAEDDDDYYIEDPQGSGPGILFQRVPEPKTVKNRLHIDLTPTDGDRASEVERAVALGATPVDIGQGEVSWTVLADPEGNEFCVLSGGG